MVRLGPLQMGGTCWFYSSLNAFLLSDAGRVILYHRMTEVFETFGPKNKNYFLSHDRAPCPAKTRTKYDVHFWKFIDQYICAYRQNRGVPWRASTSPQLLKALNLWNNNTRRDPHNSGGHPQIEIMAILESLGLSHRYKTIDWNARRVVSAGGDTQFLIMLDNKNNAHNRNYINLKTIAPKIRSGTEMYSLAGAVISISGGAVFNNNTNIEGHVVTGYISGGKGYIFDSNYQKTTDCRWWRPNELAAVLSRGTFKNYGTEHALSFALYTKDSFVRSVKMACRVTAKISNWTIQNSWLTAGAHNFTNLTPAAIRAILQHRTHMRFNNARTLYRNGLRMGSNFSANLRKIVNNKNSFNKEVAGKRAFNRVNSAVAKGSTRVTRAVRQKTAPHLSPASLRRLFNNVKNIQAAENIMRKTSPPKRASPKNNNKNN